jgi:hypothetical protein
VDRTLRLQLTTELLEESGEPGTGPDVEISADIEAFLRG